MTFYSNFQPIFRIGRIRRGVLISFLTGLRCPFDIMANRAMLSPGFKDTNCNPDMKRHWIGEKDEH